MKHAKGTQRRKKRMLILYVVFLFILSISILLMPVASMRSMLTRTPMIISGTCFWFGLIGTIAVTLKINSSRKKSGTVESKQGDVYQLGFISFFKNKEAKIADIVMIASAICFITTRICAANLYWTFSFLALFVFSFGMHCMLNGRNYIYLNHKVRREKES